MKYEAGDIVTVKTEVGTTITGKVTVGSSWDYYIPVVPGSVIWLEVCGEPSPYYEVIKVERPLPTKPGTIIKDITTDDGLFYRLAILSSNGKMWNAFTSSGQVQMFDGDTRRFIDWEPYET